MASSKNYTEVLIGGKVFTLSGFESEDYLQKVSTYLNHKLDEWHTFCNWIEELPHSELITGYEEEEVK